VNGIVTPGAPELVIHGDPESASLAAAERIVTVLADAIARRERVDWATTGGSTPGGIYRHLAVPPLRDAVAWDRVHLWWGDDRYVPRDHPQSNVLPADQVLLGVAALAGESGSGGSAYDVSAGREPGVRIDPRNVHPFPTAAAIGQARGAAWCAASYVDSLRAGGIDTVDGWPAFDLLLLGIGPDGHLLSVFPHSDAFDRPEWAFAVAAPTHVEPHVERMTLNPQVIPHARAVIVVAVGEQKAAAVRKALRGEVEVREVPARLAATAGATWILDEAAASELGSGS
jgi:6-phosphogluconolactonase